MIDLLIKNVNAGTPERQFDVAISQGVIREIGNELDYDAAETIEGEGRLLIPGFVESHVHLDIALMNQGTAPGRREPYLSHYGLNDTLERRRQAFTSEDIIKRSIAAIRLAVRHGVTAMRAQCHVDRTVGLKHLEALVRAREACSRYMTLQIVIFPQQGLTNHPDNVSLFREALRNGADVMGAAANLDRGDNGNIDFRAHLDTALEIAVLEDVDLDAHVDLGLPSTVSSPDQLETVYLAQKVLECGYQNRVTAGHVSALDSAGPEVAAEAVNIIREAQLHVVSQPDLYRLGRDDKKGRRRGLTRVKELLKAGVNVTCASNNVRDALRPMGNFDLLEEGLLLAYGAHMDTLEELDAIMKMITENPARMLGLKRYGVQPGNDADLVVLDCRTPQEAIIGQSEKNWVIKKGRILSKNECISELRW